jgi:hypothetical protein
MPGKSGGSVPWHCQFVKDPACPGAAVAFGPVKLAQRRRTAQRKGETLVTRLVLQAGEGCVNAGVHSLSQYVSLGAAWSYALRVCQLARFRQIGAQTIQDY